VGPPNSIYLVRGHETSKPGTSCCEIKDQKEDKEEALKGGHMLIQKKIGLIGLQNPHNPKLLESAIKKNSVRSTLYPHSTKTTKKTPLFLNT
jgi:hypothetical protein